MVDANHASAILRLIFTFVNLLKSLGTVNILVSNIFVSTHSIYFTQFCWSESVLLTFFTNPMYAIFNFFLNDFYTEVLNLHILYIPYQKLKKMLTKETVSSKPRMWARLKIFFLPTIHTTSFYVSAMQKPLLTENDVWGTVGVGCAESMNCWWNLLPFFKNIFHNNYRAIPQVQRTEATVQRCFE